VSQPYCFVVMGFGKKVDYSNTTRILDMDKAYEGLIKPAVVACKLRCIRSDEVKQSGIIDSKMYEMLLQADLVIADISTANPNALYELGVRHALRPYSTIIIKESQGAFHFDLNHLATLQYEHLGADIGSSEARIKTRALKALIKQIMSKPEIDSPVYTFLTNLQKPEMSKKELQNAVHQVEDASAPCAKALSSAREAAAASNHAAARDYFLQALALISQKSENDPANVDPYILQQLALHMYKAAQPKSKIADEPQRAAFIAALKAAKRHLEPLRPDESSDPETLGIAGAIEKRLWEQSADSDKAKLESKAHLDKSIEHYGRGFILTRDYYTGENYATCLDLRARTQSDPKERFYDQMTAQKTRIRIRDELNNRLKARGVKNRPDYRWMLATLANTNFALGEMTDGEKFEKLFRQQKLAQWEMDTFAGGKKYAHEIAALPT